jgi:hypothetical protein
MLDARRARLDIACVEQDFVQVLDEGSVGRRDRLVLPVDAADLGMFGARPEIPSQLLIDRAGLRGATATSSSATEVSRRAHVW